MIRRATSRKIMNLYCMKKMKITVIIVEKKKRS